MKSFCSFWFLLMLIHCKTHLVGISAERWQSAMRCSWSVLIESLYLSKRTREHALWSWIWTVEHSAWTRTNWEDSSKLFSAYSIERGYWQLVGKIINFFFWNQCRKFIFYYFREKVVFCLLFKPMRRPRLFYVKKTGNDWKVFILKINLLQYIWNIVLKNAYSF